MPGKQSPKNHKIKLSRVRSICYGIRQAVFFIQKVIHTLSTAYPQNPIFFQETQKNFDRECKKIYIWLVGI